jgi:Histidine kinase-, DNA gyrase B-, and HSP90-like ATPase
MAPRGNGSRDRSSGATPESREAPRRKRRWFRRSRPAESQYPDISADGAESGLTVAGVTIANGVAAAGGRAVDAAKAPASAPGPARAPAAAEPLSDPHADLLANVALRDLTLIESLLAIVEEAERDEQDPDRLSFLFRLDHLATRLRRSSENLLVLAGRDAPDGPSEPVPLLEVVRAAISESADYARVDIGRLPPVAIGPHAADDLSHLLAELIDNALAMSPAHTMVTVSGSGASDTVLVAVDDDGIGIPMHRLAVFNNRLAAPPALDAAAARQMGLYVVASLAHRHRIYVQMQARPGGGTSVVAALPLSVLAAIPAPPPPPPPNAVPVRVPAPVSMAAAFSTGAPVAQPAHMAQGSVAPVSAPGAGPAPWFGVEMRAQEPVTDTWTPPMQGSAPGPELPPVGPFEEEAPPQTTPNGLPRRSRPTGWAEPPPPAPDTAPADPQSVFDDLAAFDAGQRAAADAPAWEGPWES